MFRGEITAEMAQLFGVQKATVDRYWRVLSEADWVGTEASGKQHIRVGDPALLLLAMAMTTVASEAGKCIDDACQWTRFDVEELAGAPALVFPKKFRDRYEAIIRAESLATAVLRIWSAAVFDPEVFEMLCDSTLTIVRNQEVAELVIRVDNNGEKIPVTCITWCSASESDVSIPVWEGIVEQVKIRLSVFHYLGLKMRDDATKRHAIDTMIAALMALGPVGGEGASEGEASVGEEGGSDRRLTDS